MIRSQTTFERPHDFDLAAFWAVELQRFEAGLRPGSARLRASAIGLKRLAQLGAYAAQAAQRASIPDATGWARLDLPIENAEQAALALLGIGPEIEVLEPPEVHGRLRSYGEQMIRLHS